VDDTSLPYARRIYRMLLRLLPADARQRYGGELEAAFVNCLARDRSRSGVSGVISTWVHVIADTLLAAVAFRLDARRRRAVSTLSDRASATGDSSMANLWQDLKYSGRLLVRAPVFSAAIILTLGLAIGASTAVFSVVNTVLLKALPFSQPERLVLLYEAIGKSGPVGFSAPDFRGFRERAKSFDGMAAFGDTGYELSGVQQPERITAARVSASLFDVLGVAPALGRTFSVDDDEGRRPVVILSDGLWRRGFAADPGVLGRAILLDRVSYTIVGVMPRSFVFPNRGPQLNSEPADVFVPISFTNRELNGFGSMYNNSVVARLKPGVSVGQADAEARTIATSIVRELYPPQLADGFPLSASAVTMRDGTVGNVERLLYILLAAIGVVLLIACADVANLLLTRAIGRGREIAVRSALGAGRGRLAGQILVESGVLAFAGGALGIVLAYWSTATIARLAPPTIPRLHELSLDWRVLVFALAVSMTTALLCGVMPAVELSRRPTGDALKEGNRTGTAGVRQRRMLGGLVAAQFALALVMLVAGGLLLRSFIRLTSVDPGFRAEKALALPTNLPPMAYTTGGQMRNFYEALVDRVERLPGVEAAGLATDLPLEVRERRVFTIETPPAASADQPRTISAAWIIGPRYFESIGVRLQRGRTLTAADTEQSEPVVVINQTMANRFWPNLDPIDQRIAWGLPRDHTRWMRIVGIVGDVTQGPLGTPTLAQVYQPWTQWVPDQTPGRQVFISLRSLQLTVRTNGDPLTVASALQGQIRELDPLLPVARVRTLENVVRESTASQRFNTMLLSGFAAVALLLAAIGIGGVLATTVSRRTREIGLRLALGAGRGSVLAMVIRQGMSVVLIGLVIGAPAAFLAARFMGTFLFEVGVHDPLTFGAASAILLLSALVACYVPALRATRVDPMVALRIE
jgi:putative ABC transport system permease protein